MTDPLTDAVRRLKKLQQDVERLKSAQDEEGEPRLLFQVSDRATASESTRTGPDVTHRDRVLARDAQTKLVDQNVLHVDIATTADAQTKLVDENLLHVDAATAADVQEDLRLQRTMADTGAYNSIGYNTSSYEDVDILRLQSAERATATDTSGLRVGDVTAVDVAAGTDASAVRSGDITADERGRVADAVALSGGPLETATYSNTGYLTSTYQ